MNDDAFEALVMARPIVDNASVRLYAIGELEYDGPRCADEDCIAPVENDNHAEFCEECADQPHQFIHDGGYRDNWCICGRIRSIGGYSPVHTDEDDTCEDCGPLAPLPARLSPRAGSGCRRALRRVRSYGWLAGLITAGLICVAIPLLTRGQVVAWDGIHTIPTGGIR